MTVLTPSLQVEPSSRVTRIRELPVEGELLVNKGDTVVGTDIIGRAYLPGDLIILRLPEKMGLESFEVISGMKIKEGDEVSRGDLICEHAGLFGLLKTRFTAPESGVIEFVSDRSAHVGLRLPSQPIDLTAYISGKVSSVTPGKSIEIETGSAFIQGIFGVGGERFGTISLLECEDDQIITVDDIPDAAEGKILVGGTAPSYEALQKASAAGAVGFITGAIDDVALKSYLGYDLGIALTGDEEVDMTVIVTEGFGHLAMARRTLSLLKECNGMEAAINGATQVRAGALRPEIIVFKEIESKQAGDQAARSLEVGANIRIIRVPYFGERAEVIELPHEPVRINTGATTRVLKAKLESGKVVTVARANVELV